MQLLHHTDFFFEINKTINIMRLEKWFISNLDDSQRNIIGQNIDKDIAVQGAAPNNTAPAKYSSANPAGIKALKTT